MYPEYQIIRSSRKTTAIRITPAGQVQVLCPRRLPKPQIQAFVDSKLPWIEKHLARIAARPSLPPFTPEELHDLAARAKEYIPQRAAYFSPQVGVSYGRITIRSQHTRWGSCSAGGNLNFNCLLMLAPPEVLDYVVVHELCHRRELNHSPRFWAEVERILPQYREQRRWLKEHGGAIIARLPQ